MMAGDKNMLSITQFKHKISTALLCLALVVPQANIKANVSVAEQAGRSAGLLALGVFFDGILRNNAELRTREGIMRFFSILKQHGLDCVLAKAIGPREENESRFAYFRRFVGQYAKKNPLFSTAAFIVTVNAINSTCEAYIPDAQPTQPTQPAQPGTPQKEQNVLQKAASALVEGVATVADVVSAPVSGLETPAVKKRKRLGLAELDRQHPGNND